MRRLIGLVLLGLLGWVDAQGTNKYYTGPGNSSGFCPIRQCSASNSGCQPYQYVSGCSFNFSGTCTAYTDVTPGKYFSGSTGYGLSNSEGVQSRCTDCPAGKYNSGCSASSAGICTGCSGSPPANTYWITPPDATVNCQTASHTTSLAGFRTTGQNNTFPGTSVACPAPAPGKYYTKPQLPTENCAVDDQRVCPAGQVNVGYNNTFAGTCQACPAPAAGFYYVPSSTFSASCDSTKTECDTTCGTGQYRLGCNGTSSGTCQPCTTANASQIYSTGGGLTNNCQVVGCTKVCPAGQYISGCGAAGSTSTSLTCQPCSGQEPNKNYYRTQGAYLPNSCGLANCTVCSNGNYLAGCGSAASGGTAEGTCTQCSNVVY